MPRDVSQRVQIGLEHEVAVAALPRRHRVAVHGVHLDIDGEQVVAPLGTVLDDLVDEVPGGQSLALQPALHIGQAEQDGVDLAPVDPRPELVQVHRSGPRGSPHGPKV